MTNKAAPERLRETDSPAREEDVARALHAAEFPEGGWDWWGGASDRAPWKDKYRDMARAVLALRPAPAAVKPEWRDNEYGKARHALYLGGLYVGQIQHSTFPLADTPWRGWFMCDGDGEEIGNYKTADAARASVERALADALPSAVTPTTMFLGDVMREQGLTPAMENAAAARPTPAVGIPEGWQLVPKEITPEIACALEGCGEVRDPETLKWLMETYAQDWADALAAAPSPQTK